MRHPLLPSRAATGLMVQAWIAAGGTVKQCPSGYAIGSLPPSLDRLGIRMPAEPRTKTAPRAKLEAGFRVRHRDTLFSPERIEKLIELGEARGGSLEAVTTALNVIPGPELTETQVR